MAGSMGMTGELKVTRLRELALRKRMPFVWLLDSAGARMQEAAGAMFAGSGHLFREEVVMSGVIPQVAALMGPCAAGTAYIPGLADFVPMVKGRGSMALAGPHLVKAAVGEEVTQEELGGSRVHCRKSGVGDMEVADDEECIDADQAATSRTCPRTAKSSRRVRAVSDPIDRARGGAARRAARVQPQAVRHVRGDPPDRRRRRVLRHEGPVGEDDHHLLRALRRAPGGIVANQPKQLGGILDNDSADKAARFVNLCNAFAIPLVFLMDVPGFMVGTKVEADGIIRHGAKMLYAVANATVPKITVIMRKAYGAGYYVMNGRAYEPDLIVAWPSAEISVMGAEGVGRDRVPQTGRRGRGPGGQEGRADRGLPQDLRRLHRRRQRPDRRRDRPARDARDDLPRRWRWPQSKKIERPWKRHGVVPRMSLDDPVVITCSISGAIANREQCPAIPYTPRSTRRRRGGSSTRAA